VTRSRTQSWVAVLLLAGGLGLGAWALTRYAAPAEGAHVGDRAPDFRVERVVQGDSIGLRTGYAGQVVLVNLWATWCGPCRKEMPSMQAAFEAYQARGFRIAAVSLDEGDAAPVRAFATELGLTFDLLQDRSNRSQEIFQAVGLPHSVLIGRDGRVKWVALGAEEWTSAENRARIEALLADGE
jgi:cytochrome c biogenesis protein CcmG/thiol:disulfide interchange protein DsbE